MPPLAEKMSGMELTLHDTLITVLLFFCFMFGVDLCCSEVVLRVAVDAGDSDVKESAFPWRQKPLALTLDVPLLR